jgi:methanol---5-hydroxybenzimidazolylcobamide Co-methyltransferase
VYTKLAIQDLDKFVFGLSPAPVHLKNGMVIGGGAVYPELNFTLPDMAIEENSLPEILSQYRSMITSTCKRAVHLHAPGLVVEFELLPDLTLRPAWGAEVTKLLREVMDEISSRSQMPVALRVTPNDIREFMRPPLLRSGNYWELMMDSFRLCAQAGADFLAIESTGGKEIHDEAILNGDLETSVFALGILGSRDMEHLWKHIVSISNEYGAIPSGDSACGFANTAMVLADQGFIPHVWAAVIRVMTVARSLVAFEQGAIGPNKDCAYEGPFIKAITGCPITLEGAEAACAHLSPIGNIAKAVADLWSNESVNNVKLLAGMAPVVSVEQLVYATRLMNAATQRGPASALELRDCLVDSDSNLDPQAYVLKPDVVLNISRQLLTEMTPYRRTCLSARVTLEILRNAHQQNILNLSQIEQRWLDRLSAQADKLPEEEEEFIATMKSRIDPTKVRLSEYGLEKK